VADVRLSFEAYCDVIGEEAERLSQAASSSLDLLVPSCPGWTVADLIGHVTFVYRMWIAQLCAKDPSTHVPSKRKESTKESMLVAAFEASCSELLGALCDATKEGPCWNFTGVDLTAAWVARRVAHESTMHRVDAELARGRSSAIDREFAVDGIDERIAVCLPASLRRAPGASLGGSLGFVLTDADAAWVVSIESGKMTWRFGRGPVSAVVVGAASEVYLFSWNRVGLEVVELTGDAEVAEAWATLPG
jgi:uncharacterized protein (TIGR03083 family)